MPRKLTANEIDNIMVGATFLGAGGGGPLDTGRELLEKQATGSYSIDLYSMDEIAKEERDSTYGAMVACLGALSSVRPTPNPRQFAGSCVRSTIPRLGSRPGP